LERRSLVFFVLDQSLRLARQAQHMLQLAFILAVILQLAFWMLLVLMQTQ